MLRGGLADRGVDGRWVPLAAAGHSRLFDPFLAEYAASVARVSLRSPSIPFLSSLTGTWITDEQATDPGYWARQYRHTVRFAEGARELLGHPDRLLVEVGPGQTLSTFVHAQRDLLAGRFGVPSLPTLPEPGSTCPSPSHLGSRRMSIHDDFFELGGNSLLVTKVIARVNQAYRIELSLLTMFESPTVAELASCIEAVRNPAVTTQRSTP